MPQPEPTQNQLSKPVEPQFRPLLNFIVDESYEYGLKKWGAPLTSFNGRSELQDGGEELVSAFRYFVQLDMRCDKLYHLLRMLRAELRHSGDWCGLSEPLRNAIDAAVGGSRNGGR